MREFACDLPTKKPTTEVACKKNGAGLIANSTAVFNLTTPICPSITADRDGLVIHPNAAKWETGPIAEGTNVYKDQILLLMPDLSKMQVKVGIHESMVDRVRPGQVARVTLPDQTLEGTVISVATVTTPASWWTGNVVKYETIIELPSVEGLKPGMSAEVELILAEHNDVMTIPVSAVIETEQGHFCWVTTDQGPQRRSLQLGDSNDVYSVVEAGLKEGDVVVLNPLAYVDDAQDEVLLPPGQDQQADTFAPVDDAASSE